MAVGPLRTSYRQDILETFTRHVAERGYEKVTLREIAEELGISKGTIVHHYSSKQQMLRELHVVYMKRRIAEANAIIAAVERPEQQLVAIIYQNFVALRDDHVATVAFAREIVHFAHDEVMAPVRSLRHSYSELVRNIVERGMESGVLRRADPAMVTLQVFGTFNWVWTWLQLDGRWSIDDIAATFVGTLFTGLMINGHDSEELLFESGIAELVREVMSRSLDGDGQPA